MLLLCSLALAEPQIEVLLGANSDGEAIGDYDGAGDAGADVLFEFWPDASTQDVYQVFKVRNGGDEGDLTLAAQVWDDTELPADVTLCDQMTLAPDEVCEIRVDALLGTAPAGEYHTRIELETNDPNAPVFAIEISLIQPPDDTGCASVPGRSVGWGALAALGLVLLRRRD
jgi:hypothetical protein